MSSDLDKALAEALANLDDIFARYDEAAVELIRVARLDGHFAGRDEADLASPETRPYIDRFFGGAGVGAEDRLKALNLVRDLTASDFGGYNQLLAIHAEGSLEAQKITIFRDYDLDRCKDLAALAIGVNRSK